MICRPLTQAQHGIWVGQQMVPDSGAYWTAEALSLQGEMNEATWQQATDHVLRHAQSLHLQVDAQGQAHYPPLPLAHAVPMHTLDVSDQNAPWDAAWQAIEALRPPAPQMDQDPLFAQAWIRLSPAHHLWVLWAHHVVLDGWGHALLARAVAQTYEHLTQGRPAPNWNHWDMAPVVEEDLQQQNPLRLARHATFWREQLKNTRDNSVMSLAPPLPLAPTVRQAHTDVPPELHTTWRQAAARDKLDWSAWLLAGVATWMWQATGATDLVLGLPVMNRLGSAALSVPCMAMNIVPLRIQCQATDTPVSLAHQIAERLRAIRPHQRYRYETLRRDLGRMGGHRRLFGPVVNIMPFDRPTATAGLRIDTHTVAAGPVEDLAINLRLWPDEAGLTMKLEAHPHAYSHATLLTYADGLQQTWTHMAQQAHTALAQIWPVPVSSPVASHSHAALQGPPLLPLPDTRPYASAVLNAICAHAQTQADRQAVSSEAGSRCYAQLWAEVEQCAQSLQDHAHKQRMSTLAPKVLVMLPRQPHTVSVLLAVWLLGGCYIPQDPQTPPARLDMVLSDAHPDWIVTTPELKDRFPSHTRVFTTDDLKPNADHNLPRSTFAGPANPDACAYVIYTSGSTGRPNGVVISHAALGHFLSGASQIYGMHSGDRMLQFAPLHFDASVEELYLPLLNGGTVVLRNEDMLSSPARFLNTCQQWGITVLDLPTAYWHELAFALDGDTAVRAAWPEAIRLVIIGGEAALSERLQRWKRHIPTNVTLLNTYGPTETTVICTTAVLAGPHAVSVDEGVPIGTPLPGIQLRIVNEWDEPLPIGQIGQLCIQGPALSSGYLGREALTAQRFAPLPADPALTRTYRTGDLVCINAQGQLVFHGRIDDEIKISGHRIDPSEVEAALLSHPDVIEVAVLGQALPDGNKRLVAFVASVETSDQPGQRVQHEANWRQHLMPRLPATAWPSHYVVLPKLPRNANNKVDRKALQVQLPTSDINTPIVTSSLEEAIISVWSSLLGRIDLHAHSDFFNLGGRSLQAIQAATRLGVHLQREVPVSWLFAHPTVAGLAQALSAPIAHQPPPLSIGGELAPLLPIQKGHGPALFCIHPAEGLSWCYFGLCRHLPNVPIWGLQSRGMTDAPPLSFDAMVTDYLALIQKAQPHGPYRLLGWSSGGGIAHALACRLQAAGETVNLLAFMDSYPADIWEGKPLPTEGDALEALLDVIGANAWDAQGQRLPDDAMRALLRQAGGSLASLDESIRERMVDSAVHGMRLYRSAQHRVFDGPVLYFRAAIRPVGAPSPESWAPYLTQRLDMVDIDSNHNNMSQPTPMATIGQTLKPVLTQHLSPSKGTA